MTTLGNAYWRQAAWFVDPQNTSGHASDGNTGLTALTPLSTYAEILARWGTDAPILRQSTAITFISSHTDNSDPVINRAVLANGASLVIQGAAPPTTAAVFTRSAAKSTVAGANSLLAGSFSAGAPAPGVLVTNTTAGKSSRAWVYKTAGGANWNLTQPMTPMTIPGPILPLVGAEVDTWNTGDTVTLSVPFAVNVAIFQPTLIDYNVAFDNYGFLYNLTVFDPTGATNDDCYLAAHHSITECVVQRVLVVDGFASDQSASWNNIFNQGSMQGGSLGLTIGIIQVMGGALASGLASAVGGSWLFDFDFILGSSLQGFGAEFESGQMFFDANLFISAGGTFVITSGFIANPKLYGSGTNTIELFSMSTLRQRTGNTFVATFTAPGLITGVIMNGAATGSSHTSASPDVLNSGISTTPAHLDAAAGAAGFGGTAFNLGGASVSNAN